MEFHSVLIFELNFAYEMTFFYAGSVSNFASVGSVSDLSWKDSYSVLRKEAGEEEKEILFL